MGTQLPLRQRGTAPPPQFSPHICCGQTAGWIIYANWYGGGPRPQQCCVRWGLGCLLPKRGAAPQIFGPRVLWPNGWMDGSSMPLGMEVVLGPGHIVLDGTQLPQKRVIQPLPNFQPMSIMAKRLDGSRCHFVRGRPWPRRCCIRWGPSSPSPK